jgi:phosphopentomutase
MVKPVQAELRAHLIVLDGMGIGALPDAHEYGDQDSNTLGNLAEKVGGLDLPTFQSLGLGNIKPLKGLRPVEYPLFSWGIMAEKGKGKDSTIGHWELSGLISPFAFPTFPNGFPAEIVQAFEEAVGRKILGNIPASGTEIIAGLGEEHIRTGSPIVYTSADSVFQIAAHKEIVPLETLYNWCEIARRILMPPNPTVGRVIARPFIGEPGHFVRTYERRDFGVEPPGTTVLDCLHEAGKEVISVGKIDTLFAGRGFSRIEHYAGNAEGMQKALQVAKEDWTGLMFFNLIDFDQTWGHRNDFAGFYGGLQAVDAWLPDFIAALKPNDLVFITADHGNDPTTPSTDHSREYVPILAFHRQFLRGRNLGHRESFSDVAKTVAHYFNLECEIAGTSFLIS